MLAWLKYMQSSPILYTERWAWSWSRCTGSQPTGDLKLLPGSRPVEIRICDLLSRANALPLSHTGHLCKYLHMVQLMPLAPYTLVASQTSRMSLPYHCWLSQVVPENRTLNGFCCCSSVSLDLPHCTLYRLHPKDAESSFLWAQVSSCFAC